MTTHKSSVGELLKNTAMVFLLLVVGSFLSSGTGLVIAILAVCSFQFARKAASRPFLSGILPGVIAANTLQLGYFLSAWDMHPPGYALGMMLLNFAVILSVCSFFAWIAVFLRRRRETKEQEVVAKKHVDKKRVRDMLTRITSITLFAFVSVHICIPFLSSVAAVTVEHTTDSFIQTYDPDNQYETRGEPVEKNPKRRVPVDGVPEASEYEYLTPEEIEAIKIKCQQTGCNPEEVMEQLNQQKQLENTLPVMENTPEMTPEAQAHANLKSQVQNGNLKYKDIQKLQKEGKITDAQAADLVWTGVTSGKISAWDGAKHLGSGLKKAGGELWNTAVARPAQAAWNYAKENPWKAAAIVTAAVAVTAAVILFPPAAAFAGAALTYGAQAAAVWTAGNLVHAYATGGTEGLANKMFSSETRQLWRAGDIWGAMGKGVADLGITAMSMLPLAGVPKTIAAIPKIGGAIVNGVNAMRNTRNLASSLSNIRITVAITDSSGILNSGGMKIVKNAIQKGAQYGSGVVDEIGAMLKGLPKDKLAVSMLKKQGDIAEQASGLSDDAGRAVVQQAADDVVQVNREAHNAAKFDKYVRELRAAREKPQVDDPKLQVNIDKHYRPQAEIKSGSAADAHRNEVATGLDTKGTYHKKKIEESLTYFKDWKKKHPDATKKDKEAVDDMVKDIEDALGYN